MCANSRLSREVKLGDVLGEVFVETVANRQELIEKLNAIFDDFLPDSLRGQAKIASVSNGKMAIHANSPSYAYQVRLLNKELLEEFAVKCPKARIGKVAVILR